MHLQLSMDNAPYFFATIEKYLHFVRGAQLCAGKDLILPNNADCYCYLIKNVINSVNKLYSNSNCCLFFPFWFSRLENGKSKNFVFFDFNHSIVKGFWQISANILNSCKFEFLNLNFWIFGKIFRDPVYTRLWWR